MNTRSYRSEPVKNKIIHRLKIARGHLDKVVNMVEEDSYCIAIIHQSQAIQAALKKVDEEVLHNHLHNCVLKDAHAGSKNEKLVGEIMDVFQKSNIQSTG